MRQHTRTTSLGLAIGAAVAALSLSACGGSSDARFNAAFDKSTHDSCVSSAGTHGMPADQAETYCSCIVKQFAPLSVQDKMALPTHQDKMTAAAQTCIAQMSGGAAPASQAAPANAP